MEFEITEKVLRSVLDGETVHLHYNDSKRWHWTIHTLKLEEAV